MNFNWHLIRKWQCSLTFRHQMHLLKSKLLHKKQQQRCIFIAGVHWTISGSVIMMQVLRDGEHYRASRWSPVEWRERVGTRGDNTDTDPAPPTPELRSQPLVTQTNGHRPLLCQKMHYSVQRRNGKFSSYK